MGGVSVRINRGDGTFQVGADYPGGDRVAIADVNGDGRPDLVSTTADCESGIGAAFVLINTPGVCNVQSVSATD
jgi:hypothetical protein